MLEVFLAVLAKLMYSLCSPKQFIAPEGCAGAGGYFEGSSEGQNKIASLTETSPLDTEVTAATLLYRMRSLTSCL